MKRPIRTISVLMLLLWALAQWQFSVFAQETQSQSASGSEQATWFKGLLTQASLKGRWAPLKEGELGEERGGDTYQIVEVKHAGGDKWIVSAKMKYRNEEIVMPIPVQVKFAGDTAILILDKLSVPGGGTYSARVMFHDRTYSGTWSGEGRGGMLYGTIAKGERPGE